MVTQLNPTSAAGRGIRTGDGHESCKDSDSWLVVGSGPTVLPVVSSMSLGSGLARGWGDEPRFNCARLSLGAVQVPAPAKCGHSA